MNTASRSAPAARVLARFAAALRLADVPAPVVRRARHCIVDTLGVTLHGATLPWSRIVAGYAQRYGAGGACTLLGTYARPSIHALIVKPDSNANMASPANP